MDQKSVYKNDTKKWQKSSKGVGFGPLKSRCSKSGKTSPENLGEIGKGSKNDQKVAKKCHFRPLFNPSFEWSKSHISKPPPKRGPKSKNFKKIQKIQEKKVKKGSKMALLCQKMTKKWHFWDFCKNRVPLFDDFFKTGKFSYCSIRGLWQTPQKWVEKNKHDFFSKTEKKVKKSVIFVHR